LHGIHKAKVEDAQDTEKAEGALISKRIFTIYLSVMAQPNPLRFLAA
jgi:hypothetical protein